MADSIGTEFGSWLSNARAKRGVSGEALADMAQTTQAYISQLESGMRNPSRKMVERLVQALYVGEDEYVAMRMLNEGLRAALFMPQDQDPLEIVAEPILDALRIAREDGLLTPDVISGAAAFINVRLEQERKRKMREE